MYVNLATIGLMLLAWIVVSSFVAYGICKIIKRGEE